MIRRWIYGMAGNPVENSKEFKGEQFETEGGLEKWYGQEVAAKSEPLIDSGTGKPLVVRVFSFKKNPGVKRFPSKQDVFNAHAKQIRDFLWKDGLAISDNPDPKFNYTKGGYQIAVLCEARFQTMFMDKPRTLQEILSKKK